MDPPIEIPAEIFDSLQKLKATGVNMESYHRVLAQANTTGDAVLISWLRSNMKYYIQGTYYGFVPEGDPYTI